MAEYIERYDVLNIINDAIDHNALSYEGCVNEIIETIAKTPAADVRLVVRGEWGYRWKIHGDGRRPTELYPCSECGYENTSAIHFCPNCGAQMIGGDDDEI